MFLDRHILSLSAALQGQKVLKVPDTALDAILEDNAFVDIIKDNGHRLWEMMKKFTMGYSPNSIISPRQFVTMMQDAEVTRWCWERGLQAAFHRPDERKFGATDLALDGTSKLMFSEFLTAIVEISQDYPPAGASDASDTNVVKTCRVPGSTHPISIKTSGASRLSVIRTEPLGLTPLCSDSSTSTSFRRLRLQR